MSTDHVIDYELSIGGRLLLAERVEGREALSEPAHFRVSALLPIRDPLATDDVTGTECTLTLRSDREPMRTLTLVAMAVERGARVESQGVQIAVPLDVELKSRIALAAYRVDIRIFRDLDVPTIVEKVLTAFGIGVERRLTSSYAIRPFTVQWRESDLAFVSRLLEDEGIYYVTRADGGIILGDSPSAYTKALPLEFIPRDGFVPGHDCVTKAGWIGRMTPSRVTMRDFDFKKPKLDVTSTASVNGRASTSGGELYIYPAARLDPGSAGTKATRSAEAFVGAQHRLRGSATRLSLAPNDELSIGSLPEGLEDGLYAIVSLEHAWDRPAGQFELAFEAIDAKHTFRPLPETPRPCLAGATVGTVTGAAGEDIHTDEWGRAKVHFHWDRLQPLDDHCSDWIPTLQDNTGHSIGIPRIGWEMLVQHLEGDPDRPIILGRLYTPADDFYSHLPDNKMYTTLRSLSSPRTKAGDGTQGHNLIEFRDLKDYEHIRFFAERDQVVLTEHDRTETTLERDSREVHGHEKVKVGKSRTHHVGQDATSMVGADQTVTIGNDRKIAVGGKHAETSKGGRKLSIGSLHFRRFGTMDEVSVMDTLDETIGALNLEMSPQGNVSNTLMTEALLVGGAIVELAKQGISQAATKVHAELIGVLLHQEAKEHIGLRATKTRKTTTGGNYTGTSGTAVLISGVKSLKMTLGALSLTAKKKLTLKVQDTTLVLDGDHHAIDAPEEITAHATGRNDLNAAKSGQNDRLGGS